MTYPELTGRDPAATPFPTKGKNMPMGKCGAAMLGVMASILGACVNINAPEDAIVIELNVNIQAEVVYRLAEDAGNAIEENADIF